jgi:CubicO group peptidase (beta-lactamase class C family)
MAGRRITAWLWAYARETPKTSRKGSKRSMTTTPGISESTASKPTLQFGRLMTGILRVVAWALLILATFLTALFLGCVLLGVVLLGSAPATDAVPLPAILLALLALTCGLAWLVARYFASGRRVAQTVGVIAALVALIETVWALSAPDDALYVARAIAWGESKFYTYHDLFQAHPLHAAPAPFHFPVSPDPRVEQVFANVSGSSDWNTFLAEHDTQALVVIHDGQVVYENYFNNTRPDTMLTSFSMAKSFTSALIGAAIQDGYIKSVDDPITTYLPELARRDPRFNAITIRNLLMMASGLDYQEDRALILNGDDPLTTYFPDQRQISLENTHIIDAPARYWHYNKYHPQLLGMILERTTGKCVTGYLQEKFWDPLGMQYDGSWSIDSQKSDFEKMEAGINARAIDFAKFGELFLHDGNWQGKQVISKAWVDESTRPYLPEHYASYYPESFLKSYGRTYYTYMWWGTTRGDGSYDFSAEGDHGQFIYVSPQKHLVIVRNGVEWGLSADQWFKLFYDFASQY